MNSTMLETWENARKLFELRLEGAFGQMRGGSTVLVIVPAKYPKGAVINYFVKKLNDCGWAHRIRVMPEAVHIEGSTGQVRVYDTEHATYDRKQKRLLDYPGGIPTVIHPAVEETT